MKLDHSLAAVVTGGASGLGEATVRMLRAADVRVAILDLAAERGERLARETGAAFLCTDVTDEKSVDNALASARARNGIERVLVNCAGISVPRRLVSKHRETRELTSHDLAGFQRTLNINLGGTFLVCARSGLAMATLDPVTPDGGRGVIVNTASIAAQDGQVGQTAYAASKGGVLAMTLPMARDLAAFGIRVMCVLPGSFETPLFDTLSTEVRRRLEAEVPFPSRLGKPEEFGRLVAAIIDNDMLNGASIRLDGAVRMLPR